eukprot:COSAG01_NODE_18461_length_1074_cov_1.683077_1_plen_105_part_00
MYFGVALNLASDRAASNQYTGQGHSGKLVATLTALDDLVDGIQEVFLTYCLAPGTDREHACFRAHASNVCARVVGAEPCKKFEADVALTVHCARVDFEDLRAPL